MSDKVLLIAAATSYNADDFVAAAQRLGVEVVLASDRCHVLDQAWAWPETSVVLDFYEPQQAAMVVEEAARRFGVRALVPVGGEAAALVAAMAGNRLGLPVNSVESATAARNKRHMASLLTEAGIPSPRSFIVEPEESAAQVTGRVEASFGFPCVVKPLLLSTSRGVMRADDAVDLAEKLARLRTLLAQPALAELDPPDSTRVLVQEFIPGVEVALEGLLETGLLRTLALFDKPDPLDGPFFEETIYVTPSRLPAATQSAIRRVAADAATALGLVTGPVHAELRISPKHGGPVVIEVAARSIGGLCGRMLRFGTGLGLEEVILRHALGRDVASVEREGTAAGAMMIPIPSAGVLQGIRGVDEARAVPGIEDVVISVEPGRVLVPLPEGSSYLGFLFARGASPATVEAALREAHRCLELAITPTLKTG